MDSQEKELFELRLRYSRCEAFAPERAEIWAKIQEAEAKMPKEAIHRVTEAVIFAPEPNDQLELPLAG